MKYKVGDWTEEGHKIIDIDHGIVIKKGWDSVRLKEEEVDKLGLFWRRSCQTAPLPKENDGIVQTGPGGGPCIVAFAGGAGGGSGQIRVGNVSQNDKTQKEEGKMASELTNLKDELFGATLDGAKAGLAASMGRKITDLVIRSVGVPLPNFLQQGIGKDALPIVVCYAVAFLSMALPGVPGSEKVRKYCILCARGSATVLVNNIEFMDRIEQLTTFISGLASNNPLEDK